MPPRSPKRNAAPVPSLIPSQSPTTIPDLTRWATEAAGNIRAALLDRRQPDDGELTRLWEELARLTAALLPAQQSAKYHYDWLEAESHRLSQRLHLHILSLLDGVGPPPQPAPDKAERSEGGTPQPAARTSSPRGFVPQPLQTSADVARVLNALRNWLQAYEPVSPLLSKVSQANDEFRRAFCVPGDSPPSVSVDSTGLPDGTGLPMLIRESTYLNSEARDALEDLFAHRIGVVTSMTNDTGQRFEAVRCDDGTALRQMRGMLRTAIAKLEPHAKQLNAAPSSTSAPPNETQQGEGEKPKPDDKPNGPFDADGFRFAGVDVRFGKAGKQYGLVMALWDAKKKSPAAPRPVEDVIAEVWGNDNETEDSAFRQLCADTRTRFQKANCPLDIRQVNGKVQLSPL